MTTMIRIIIVSLYTASVIGSRSTHHHLLASHGHSRSSYGLLARQGCSASNVPCNGKCIPSDGVCCPDGNYCDPGWLCWPQDSGCCKPGYVVCGIGCMPPGSACCDSYGNYCDAGEQCILISNGASKCCPATETCDGQVAVTTFATGTTITDAVPSTTIPSTALPSSSAPATSLLSTSIASTLVSTTTIESVVPSTSIVTTTLQSAPGPSAPPPSTVIVLTTVPFVPSTSEVSIVIIETDHFGEPDTNRLSHKRGNFGIDIHWRSSDGSCSDLFRTLRSDSSCSRPYVPLRAFVLNSYCILRFIYSYDSPNDIICWRYVLSSCSSSPQFTTMTYS
jgi:hypothetical protein